MCIYQLETVIRIPDQLKHSKLGEIENYFSYFPAKSCVIRERSGSAVE